MGSSLDRIHSDRGFQYTSMAYKKFMEKSVIRISMSRPANPKDNAPMESFFGVLKTECLYWRKPQKIAEAITLTEEFVKYYNNERVILKYGGTPKIFSPFGEKASIKYLSDYLYYLPFGVRFNIPLSVQRPIGIPMIPVAS